MAEEGARVAILDIDEGAAKSVAAEIGATAHVADVTDPDGLQAAVDRAATTMDGITTLFNNAGVGSVAPLHEWALRSGTGSSGST